ncbi:aromatic alcohol reductase [Aspergillus novofumigatus IBT 16806]|uniref:NmrA-like family protein n=1 Tax=Aspergillus novofumigatus (strain IBT 16806) TaxID=1392255 RepID=A0A2I1C924_ASPN1|nr:NmrA-like family protein [Aspergillus novofumigatus IBT 16806]PKX94123.1 NmrA-like family protein [Aspergillus novofumigatus IBT 16806]
MSPKVAIAGATGNLGPPVLNALLSAGFEVTVLTRAESDRSNNNFGQARVVPVDYTSLDSLTAALKGQDVVVNTLGAIPRDIHLRLIDAAITAQVQRFIPSEFGSDTTNAAAAKLPVYQDKVAIQKYLQEKAAESAGSFSYTLLINGPFLDWGLAVEFLLNWRGPEVELYDGGERKFSATTLAGVANGIVGIINNLEATRNRTVYIREIDVSQSELLKLTGKQLPTKSISTAELEKEGYAELSKPNPNPGVFVFNFLRRAIFGEGCGSLFPAERLSNDLLGVKTLSKEALQEIVSRSAK